MNEWLICPGCGVEMQTVSLAGVEVERCPECKGLWFDLMELQDVRAVEGSAAELGDDKAQGGIRNEGGRECPRCPSLLLKTRDPDQPHIEYDKCPVCSGIYFDAGEFADLQEVTLLEKLKSWL